MTAAPLPPPPAPMPLQIRPPKSCAFDQVSLGEVMLRLDPGEGRDPHRPRLHRLGRRRRIQHLARACASASACAPPSARRSSTTRSAIWSRTSSCRAAWRPTSSGGATDDGIGRTVRNGLNFTERGFGMRGAVGVPDRGNTAASQLKPGDFDWDHIFGKLGRPLVPHRRHLRRALRLDRRAGDRGGARPRSGTAPSSPTTSTTAPRSGNDRRPEEGPRGQPRDRQARRRHDRQRGGFHRLARLRGRRAPTTALEPSRPPPSRR